jgi:hypothetical protein
MVEARPLRLDVLFVCESSQVRHGAEWSRSAEHRTFFGRCQCIAEAIEGLLKFLQKFFGVGWDPSLFLNLRESTFEPLAEKRLKKFLYFADFEKFLVIV